MEIRNNYTSHVYKQNFKAKYLHTDDLQKVVKYAVEKGKFNQLNESRKNVEQSYLKTRLKVEIGKNEKDFPFITFTRFVPKRHVIIPQGIQDYNMEKIVTYQSQKQEDVLSYALNKLIKLGNSAPESKMFKNIVINK